MYIMLLLFLYGRCGFTEDRFGVDGDSFGLVTLDRLTEKGECVFTKSSEILLYRCKRWREVSCNVEIVKAADRYVLGNLEPMCLEPVYKTYGDQVGRTNNGGHADVGEILGGVKTAAFGIISVSHVFVVELNVTLDKTDKVAGKSLTCGY